MARLTKSQQEVWDRLKYVPKPQPEPWTVSASSTPPFPPINGSIYFDTNKQEMLVYDGTQWKAII